MHDAQPLPDYIAEMAALTQAAIGIPDRQDALEQALTGILHAAVASGICDLAGVTEKLGKKLHSAAVTDQLASRADELQYELTEGPCVQAAFTDDTLISQDLHNDPRWPRWAPGAARLGIRAVISVHLYTARDAMGAINLYSRQPRTYTSRDLEMARFIGSTASFALGHHRTTENLWAAIDARHRIGAAQGVLIGKYDITQEQAFDVLRRLSSRHEKKIADMATLIINARGLPPELAT